MVQFLEASIGFKLDTDKVRAELSRFGGQVGTEAEHIGKMLSARMIDANAIKAKLAEIKNAVSAVRQMTEFGFKVKDLEGSKQGSQMLDAMTRQLSVLQNQFMELGRQKQKFLSEPDSPVTARALQEIAHQQAEIMRQRGLLGQMKPQLENRTKYLEGSEAKEAAREAMAANAIRIRQAAELEAAARREQAANDISKATSRNMLSQRQRGEDADRKEALKAMRGGITPRERFEAEDRAAADAAASAAMKRRNEMELRNRAMQEQQAKDDNRAAMPFYNRLTEPAVERANRANQLPPRMDGTAGRAGIGGAGAGRGMNTQGLIQLSYGFQDLATVMGAGGNLQQGMVAMSNNLGAMLTMTGSVAGAFGGLAITLAALGLPKVIDWFKEMWKEADHTADKVRGLRFEFEQFGRASSINVGLQGFRAGEHGDLDLLRQRKGAGGEEADSVKHGFRDFSKNLDAAERGMKIEDAKANAAIETNKPRIEELDRKINDSQRAAEHIAATTGANALLPFRPKMPEGILAKGENDSDLGKHVLSKEEEAAIREEREKLSKEMAAAQDVLKEDVEKRKVIAKERVAIARELAAEEAKNADVEKRSFNKRMASRRAETEDSEFAKRRIRADEERDEELKKVHESDLDPIEKIRRGGQIGGVYRARNADIDKDEARARNRFMGRLESEQNGTGSVAAIRDRLADNLEHIDQLFEIGSPEHTAAIQQAHQTAFSENRRVLNANRPKGGDYIGIEDFSKHLQSSLSKDNPDEKAIRVATEAAAKALEKMLESQGFVLGAT